jgi:hypothetical protein
MTTLLNYLPILSLLPWAVLWLAGGIWLARAAFRLPAKEEFIVGIAIGWIAQNWSANLLAQVLPIPLAFWLASGLVFLGGGLAVARRWGVKGLFDFHIPSAYLLALAAVIFVAFSIGRGLAIFDDFVHLPTASVMAAGDIPPHFILDPQVVFGYHHFLLLFSAQLIRTGGLMPWIAVDASRAISVGLAILLAFLFSRRLTRSLMGGLLGGAVVAFSSGTRWLLLLVPSGGVDWLGQNIHLANSTASLAASLAGPWAVEGSGPMAFPFAFANGIYPAGVIQAHNANGLTGFVLIFLLLLTFNRWRGGLAAVLSAVLISVWGLIGETELPALAAGWGVVALACLLLNRGKPLLRRLPAALWVWLGVMAAGGLIGLLEGGAWTDMLAKAISGWLGNPAASYQTVGFQLAWPPAIVSSHLGVLPLFDPRELLVALLELGPLLLIFPLLVIWGLKAFRLGRWFEAATVASAVVMVLMVFVQFSGSTGVRNTPRLYTFMPVLAAFAAPLAWIWVSHRSQAAKAWVAALGLVTVTGGLVMFGVEMVAIQRPVYSYYLTTLDGYMTHTYWNKLDPGTLVFDPIPSRAPTVLGRPTDSNTTWYKTKPEWDALFLDPDPLRLLDAGFRYFYLDSGYWNGLSPKTRQALSGGCIKVIGEVDDNLGNFRRLLDLKDCR